MWLSIPSALKHRLVRIPAMVPMGRAALPTL